MSVGCLNTITNSVRAHSKNKNKVPRALPRHQTIDELRCSRFNNTNALTNKTQNKNTHIDFALHYKNFRREINSKMLSTAIYHTKHGSSQSQKRGEGERERELICSFACAMCVCDTYICLWGYKE